jgi:tRNA nucleotidyltransferase/poly(A) polymerase
MEMFMVGGAVRDEIMGVASDDIDFSVVLTGADMVSGSVSPYDTMVRNLESMNIKIFRDDDGVPIHSQHFTARGKAPKDFPVHPNRALDFVLARKEGNYSDGRRPDSVEVGSLNDDLARRDFTMNAIAKAPDGTYIDPFNGRADIEARIIRAVGDPKERLMEDALRAVRAIRFSLTKNFRLEGELEKLLRFDNDILDAVAFNISDDRIRGELNKMLFFNSLKTILLLNQFPALTGAMFHGSVSLEATMKTKGRGKQ